MVKKTVKKVKPIAKTPIQALAIIKRQTAQVEKDSKKVAKITSERGLENASAYLADVVKPKLKQIAEARTFFVKPLKDHVRNMEGLFNAQEAPLELVEKNIKEAIAKYMLERDAAADKEEQRLLNTRERNDARRVTVNTAPMPTVERKEATVRSEGGGRVTGVKKNNYRILDLTKVPREFLRIEINHSAVIEAINGGGMKAIAGLDIYPDIEVRATAS